MQQILVYSDSLTWGLIPNTRKRFEFHQRWPGILENTLNSLGADVRIIENCLNGRRTVWADPYKEGRDGSVGLAQVMEINSPLKLVILMLGTNDFQCLHDNNAWLSAQGMAKLIRIIQQSPIEPGMPSPKIMLIAPPVIINPKGDIAHKFKGAEKRSIGLADELKKIAEGNSAYFFDAGSVTASSKVDGIHLDQDQHMTLGLAVAQVLDDYKIF